MNMHGKVECLVSYRFKGFEVFRPQLMGTFIDGRDIYVIYLTFIIVSIIVSGGIWNIHFD